MIIDSGTFKFTDSKGFIALEGPNGAGKTTLQNKLAEFFEARSKKVIKTMEPGGTQLGRELRKALLEHPHGALSPLTEVFLFAADRAQHVAQVIRPALDKRTIVITDRYFYSSIAFQGYGRGLPVDMVESVNLTAVSGLQPDLIILLDIDPAEGLGRTKDRNIGKDNFENEELDFHARLRQGFLEIAKKSTRPFLVVDARKDFDTVFAQVMPAAERWLSSL